MAAAPTELMVARSLDEANDLLARGEGWVLASTHVQSNADHFVLSREIPMFLPPITGSPWTWLSDLVATAKAQGATSILFAPHPLGLEVWFSIDDRPVRHGRLDTDSQAVLKRYLREVTSTEAVDTALTGEVVLSVGGANVAAEVVSKPASVYSVDLRHLG